MHFKCKPCGSNDYIVEKNQIICNYCGSSYLYEEKTVDKKSENRLLIPLGIVLVLGLTALLSFKDPKPQEKAKEIQPHLQNSAVNINNTNAQIGTQIVNINSKVKEQNPTNSGKIVHHTRIKNEKNSDDSVGKYKDENGNIRKATYYKRPKHSFDSRGNLIIDNKNLNFTDQKVERFINKYGLKTTIVTTSGFNKKDNIIYLDKKGVIPILAQAELPGLIVSHVKLSKDATKLFYISKYDIFIYC